jgi:Putative DNA-binding domain
MRTLPDLQAGFAAAILREDAHGVASLIIGDGLTPAARVQVYWNHVFSSLTEALEATYPVVCRLVDRRFFGFAADRYIRLHPPEGPCLFEYGATFPDFLATFPPCAGNPYLADVARLEWAMNAALHAEEAAPMDPTALGAVPTDDVGRLIFRFEPSATWLRSRWPVDRIWKANQAEADPDATVNLAAGGVMLETRRQDDGVALRRLDAAEFAFRAALGQGLTLEMAADLSLAEDPGFDMTTALRALLGEGLLTGFTLVPQAPQEGDSR